MLKFKLGCYSASPPSLITHQDEPPPIQFLPLPPLLPPPPPSSSPPAAEIRRLRQAVLQFLARTAPPHPTRPIPVLILCFPLFPQDPPLRSSACSSLSSRGAPTLPPFWPPRCHGDHHSPKQPRQARPGGARPRRPGRARSRLLLATAARRQLLRAPLSTAAALPALPASAAAPCRGCDLGRGERATHLWVSGAVGLFFRFCYLF